MRRKPLVFFSAAVSGVTYLFVLDRPELRKRVGTPCYCFGVRVASLAALCGCFGRAFRGGFWPASLTTYPSCLRRGSKEPRRVTCAQFCLFPGLSAPRLPSVLVVLFRGEVGGVGGLKGGAVF